MTNTSEKILEHAKLLFNERGYNNVSLRNIAVAAGTTIGNLTYHFPKKEDLVTTIQLELYTDFFNINYDMNNAELLFKEIINTFYIMDKNRDNNIFFYKNIVELCNESKKIANNVDDFRNKIYNFYLSCFIKLQEYQIMRPDISKQQFEVLTYIISNNSYIWRQDTTLYYDINIPRLELCDALISLIYPYLSKYGVDLYKSLISHI